MALCLLSATILLVQFDFVQAAVVQKEGIEAIILNYLRAKNSAKVTGDMDNLRANLERITSSEIQDNAISEADREFNALQYDGDYYIAEETAIQLLSKPQTIKGGNISVLVEENSILYLSTDGGPDKTEQRIEHIIILAKAGKGAWSIVSDIIKDEPKPLIPPPGSKSVPQDTLFTQVAPQGLLPLNDQDDAFENIGLQAAYYNGSAAASYAYTWALSRNPAYRSFSADCTNFTSQALRAGGWWDVTGWYLSTSAWWYTSLNQSRTWVNAHYWYWFIRNRPRGYVAQYFNQMQRGDILQMDFNRDGYVDHSMVVTAKDSYGTIYLSYHTTDTRNRSINSILSQYPNAVYYGWRIYYYIN